MVDVLPDDVILHMLSFLELREGARVLLQIGLRLGDECSRKFGMLSLGVSGPGGVLELGRWCRSVELGRDFEVVEFPSGGIGPRHSHAMAERGLKGVESFWVFGGTAEGRMSNELFLVALEDRVRVVRVGLDLKGELIGARCGMGLVGVRDGVLVFGGDVAFDWEERRRLSDALEGWGLEGIEGGMRVGDLFLGVDGVSDEFLSCWKCALGVGWEQLAQREHMEPLAKLIRDTPKLPSPFIWRGSFNSEKRKVYWKRVGEMARAFSDGVVERSSNGEFIVIGGDTLKVVEDGIVSEWCNTALNVSIDLVRNIIVAQHFSVSTIPEPLNTLIPSHFYFGTRSGTVYSSIFAPTYHPPPPNDIPASVLAIRARKASQSSSAVPSPLPPSGPCPRAHIAAGGKKRRAILFGGYATCSLQDSWICIDGKHWYRAIFRGASQLPQRSAAAHATTRKGGILIHGGEIGERGRALSHHDGFLLLQPQ